MKHKKGKKKNGKEIHTDDFKTVSENSEVNPAK